MAAAYSIGEADVRKACHGEAWLFGRARRTALARRILGLPPVRDVAAQRAVPIALLLDGAVFGLPVGALGVTRFTLERRNRRAHAGVRVGTLRAHDRPAWATEQSTPNVRLARHTANGQVGNQLEARTEQAIVVRKATITRQPRNADLRVAAADLSLAKEVRRTAALFVAEGDADIRHKRGVGHLLAQTFAIAFPRVARALKAGQMVAVE